ncbi:hypothetical protein BX666DRAFT_2119448 [Dichotomocladium elegans]|nr:hypothetical protein BX666DRAFT_2119448 [Dichotomocladium elegans]
MTHILELSELPHEILNRILQQVMDRDLVRMGRLNRFYRELAIPNLTERVMEHMGRDGWRIYATMQMDARCGPVAPNSSIPDWFDGDQEVRLLGDTLRIDQGTLDLCFAAVPLDEQDGFRPLTATASGMAALASLRQIVLPADGACGIEIDLYICKISCHSRRLLRVDNISTATLPTRRMAQFLSSSSSSSSSHPTRCLAAQALFEPERIANVTYRATIQEGENAMMIEFEEIRITPEGWLLHISNLNDNLAVPTNLCRVGDR